MTTAAPAAPELARVPVNLIDIIDNPRDKVDTKSESFKQLTASIRRLGVIQAIEVERVGDRYRLVAGQRRVLAARDAGLEDIPAQIVEANGSTHARSLAENLHRENLTPMQEARAFKHASETMSTKEIAGAYSVSEDYVRQRIGFTALPKQVQDGLDTGGIPLAIAKFLGVVSEKSQPLAAAIAAGLADKKNDSVTVEQLQKNTANAVRSAVRDYKPAKGDEAPFVFWAVSNEIDEDALEGMDEEAVAKARDLYERRPRNSWDPLFSKADLDEAKAYGAALTLTDTYNRDTVAIVDRQFFQDRLMVALERRAKRGDKDRAEDAKREKERAARYPNGREAQAQRTPEEKKEKLAEGRRGRLDALRRNTELGEALVVKAKDVPVTKESLAMVAELLLAKLGRDLFLRGMRYTHADFKTVEPAKKEGNFPKVEWVDTDTQADALLYAAWDRCKTTEQMMGFLTQLVVAARHADQDETTSARRKSFTLPGSPFGYVEQSFERRRAEFEKAVDKVAGRVLPRSVKQWDREHREARDARLSEERLRYGVGEEGELDD